MLITYVQKLWIPGLILFYKFQKRCHGVNQHDAWPPTKSRETNREKKYWPIFHPILHRYWSASVQPCFARSRHHDRTMRPGSDQFTLGRLWRWRKWGLATWRLSWARLHPRNIRNHHPLVHVCVQLEHHFPRVGLDFDRVEKYKVCPVKKIGTNVRHYSSY